MVTTSHTPMMYMVSKNMNMHPLLAQEKWEHHGMYEYNLKVGQKVKVKVTRSKFMISNERSGREVSLCEISKPKYV